MHSYLPIFFDCGPLFSPFLSFFPHQGEKRAVALFFAVCNISLYHELMKYPTVMHYTVTKGPHSKRTRYNFKALSLHKSIVMNLKLPMYRIKVTIDKTLPKLTLFEFVIISWLPPFRHHGEASILCHSTCTGNTTNHTSLQNKYWINL